MASYANSLNDFLKRQPPAPTNFGTSGPTPIESPVPRVPFPEGPTLRNAAPGGAPPVAETPAPVSGSSPNSTPGPTSPISNVWKPSTGPASSGPSKPMATSSASPVRPGSGLISGQAGLVAMGAGESLMGLADIGWEGTKAMLHGAESPYQTAYNQYMYDETAAAGKSHDTPRPEQKYSTPAPTVSRFDPMRTASAEPMTQERAAAIFRRAEENPPVPLAETPSQTLYSRRKGDALGPSLGEYGARERQQKLAKQVGGAKPPREPPAPLEAGDQVITPKLTSLGNGYGVSGANTSGRAGYSQRTYYDPSGNVVASGLSSATGRGGFVGAATDAQAERNQRARMEQDAAAGANAASMNRAAAAMRDLRAAQVADKDGYERQTGLSSMLAPSAPAERTDPLSLPGDSFQDTRGRRAEFDRLREQATSGSRRERASAQAGLSALMGLAGANAPNGRSGSDAAGDDRLRTLLNQREREIDNARSQANADRSYDLQAAQFRAAQEQNRFNRGHQVWQADRSEKSDRVKLGEDRARMVEDTFKTFGAETKNAVNPAAVMDYGRNLLARTNLAANNPDMAQRIRDGVPTLEDLHRLRAWQGQNNDYWFFRPTEQDVLNKYYK